MSHRLVHITIDLTDLGPAMSATTGTHGYLTWTRDLSVDLRSALASAHGSVCGIDMKNVPLRDSDTKGSDLILAVGAITAAISLGGAYAIDPTRTTSLLHTILEVLKSHLTPNTSMTLSYDTRRSSRGSVAETVTVHVTARDSDSAAQLVDAGRSLVNDLQTLPARDSIPTITITPRPQ